MDKILRRIEVGVERQKLFEIEVDGEKIVAYEGETVAAALIASGRNMFRREKKMGRPRGLYCGIGQCQECRMTINGVPDTLACKTIVTPGSRIEINND